VSKHPFVLYHAETTNITDVLLKQFQNTELVGANNR
jgi:hypothetical protein